MKEQQKDKERKMKRQRKDNTRTTKGQQKDKESISKGHGKLQGKDKNEVIHGKDQERKRTARNKQEK